MRPHLAHRAPVLTDRPHTAPQGRESQGWPIYGEMACHDSTQDDEPKREAMSAAEAWLLMVIYLLSCVIAASVLCAVADALAPIVRGWLS